MTPDGPREDEPPEETVGARDMSQKETQAKPGTDAQTKPQRAPPAEPNTTVPSEAVVWVRITPRSDEHVVITLLTAAVVCGAFCSGRCALLSVGSSSPSFWQRCSPGGRLASAAPQTDQTPLAIVLTYLGLVVALLFCGLLPILVDQIRSLTNFVAAVANSPEGPTNTLRG